MNQKIKVFICDDHNLFREGIKALFRGSEVIDVVGEASDGREGFDKINEIQPDIVLMDIAMPGLPGFEATARIRESALPVKVIILSMHNEEELVRRCVEAGAAGFVNKDGSTNELTQAIKTVHRGEEYFSSVVLQTLLRRYVSSYQSSQIAPDGLTPREREILRFLAAGLTVKETAVRLNLSAKTVDVHKYNLMRKIGVHNRSSLIKYALQKRLIDANGSPNATWCEVAKGSERRRLD